MFASRLFSLPLIGSLRILATTYPEVFNVFTRLGFRFCARIDAIRFINRIVNLTKPFLVLSVTQLPNFTERYHSRENHKVTDNERDEPKPPRYSRIEPPREHQEIADDKN